MRITLALTRFLHFREQSKIGRPYPLVIKIVELVVLALDVERTEMDRPVIGLHQIHADAPVVERQIEPKLLLADDDAQDRPIPRAVLATITLAPETHERKHDGQTVGIAVPPNHHRPRTRRQGNAELPAASLPFKALLRQSHLRPYNAIRKGAVAYSPFGTNRAQVPPPSTVR